MNRRQFVRSVALSLIVGVVSASLSPAMPLIAMAVGFMASFLVSAVAFTVDNSRNHQPQTPSPNPLSSHADEPVAVSRRRGRRTFVSTGPAQQEPESVTRRRGPRTFVSTGPAQQEPESVTRRRGRRKLTSASLTQPKAAQSTQRIIGRGRLIPAQPLDKAEPQRTTPAGTKIPENATRVATTTASKVEADKGRAAAVERAQEALDKARASRVSAVRVAGLPKASEDSRSQQPLNLPKATRTVGLTRRPPVSKVRTRLPSPDQQALDSAMAAETPAGTTIPETASNVRTTTASGLPPRVSGLSNRRVIRAGGFSQPRVLTVETLDSQRLEGTASSNFSVIGTGGNLSAGLPLSSNAPVMSSHAGRNVAGTFNLAPLSVDPQNLGQPEPKGDRMSGKFIVKR